MKFSVSSYSFAKMIQAKEITPFDCIAKAKELGFDGIEFVDFIDILHIPEDERVEYAKKLKAEADRCGLEITSFTVAADFLTKENEVQRIKTLVDIGEILGVKRMRHDATSGYGFEVGKYKTFDSVVEQVAAACREVTIYAESKGITTMMENHGFFSQDSDRVEKLYNAINHPNFKILCDMGNFLCADEDPALAFAKLAPLAGYAHAKDFIFKSYNEPNPGMGSFQTRSGNYLRGTIIGHGNVPVKQCLYLLHKAGYDDAIAIEFEGVEDVITALTIGLDNLKRYWAEVTA
ncbi:MAG: sugar phosphate isomerase/epimerase family protein [Clostridia bacterium]